MMLTHHLTVLAHDLAKQCHVSGPNKPQERPKVTHKNVSEGIQMDVSNHRRLADFYELGAVIGNGGFGAVHAGTCKKTGISVAIKAIPKERVFCWSKIGDRMVPKEVALLHNLQQKYVIRMLDYFEGRDNFYIIMERPEKYIDLFDYITQKGTVSERSTRYLFRQVLEAVQYCLSMGVVHRDVKDENILIDLKSNQVKLIDFGSGTFLQDDVYTEYEGTYVYCPPEWVLERCYHAIPATVWSLGILLYDMLLGDIPFEAESEIAMADLSFHVNISKGAESLIRWMLSVRPQNRPTIEQVLKHPWMNNSSSSSSSSSHTKSRPPSTSSSISTSSFISSSSSLSSNSSSSNYRKIPPCYRTQVHPPSPSLPHRTVASTRQSSRQALGNDTSRSPRPAPTCALSSPVQTRSQSRLNQSYHVSPAMEGRRGFNGGGARCVQSHGGGGHLAGGDSRVGSVPKSPIVQVRKSYYGSQVNRKK